MPLPERDLSVQASFGAGRSERSTAAVKEVMVAPKARKCPLSAAPRGPFESFDWRLVYMFRLLGPTAADGLSTGSLTRQTGGPRTPAQIILGMA
jgi:hypothetical protein